MNLRIRITPMCKGMKEAIVFVLILFAFIIAMCWIEMPPLVDKYSRNKMRNQGQTVTQGIDSIKTGDQK